ncbi:efflux RND transporter periplasmic adaptor subunit [Ruficoccus amylovorans]|uniref:Efflux RND transporter periplasmic adaptor subunit n=1 Tax=Ruficoccus amylovorans TaxID=1804625 RepID=A0A842HF64_9BACT|nr:efflux RND transporter periplasmic adaptor subunit [Ruficoccus amylovorans]MBC2593951.1 efflux RND transporter periplasmic adaptor subunit [Ruficoccus amylovorans]
MKTFELRHIFQRSARLLAYLASILALGQPGVLRAEADHNGHDHDHGSHSHEGHDHSEGDGHDHDAAASAGGHDTHDDHDGHDHEEGVVVLSAEVMKEFGITIGQAGPGVLHEEVVLPGSIQFNRERVAYVTPRFAGTVMEIKARLADKVEAGQVLATLESTDTLRPFEVKAPFDGVITAYEVSLGQTVEAGEPIFTVADLSTVWADLRIYQRDMGKLTQGQPVLVSGGQGSGVFRGTVAYIAPVVDEHTRTGLARVVVKNHDGTWRPGQFVKGAVGIASHEEPVVVPRAAIVEYEGQPVVFVQTDEGFEPRPLVLGHADSESFEVEDGLLPGETYVTANPISLKAELGKGSFGGHQH